MYPWVSSKCIKQTVDSISHLTWTEKWDRIPFFAHFIVVCQYFFFLPFCARQQDHLNNFSYDGNVFALWGIASAKGTMMVKSVVAACSATFLGFLVPKLP